ncbi:emopamil-binding protein-like isoform X2 [Carcharodon carcharias]|uniref:emopamil-binding protein-like isoform X2 n=1 Tax=Carcharodon carcharias TaxID=13397 RepID=UPI001B7D9F2F|nr:emopamil-binding protein-like isoform X2 [Carcharodon carcharias]
MHLLVPPRLGLAVGRGKGESSSGSDKLDAGMSGEPLLRPAALCSLLLCAAQVPLAWALTLRFGQHCPPLDRALLGWLFYDATVHFTLEGPFVYMSLMGTVAQSDNILASLSVSREPEYFSSCSSTVTSGTPEDQSLDPSYFSSAFCHSMTSSKTQCFVPKGKSMGKQMQDGFIQIPTLYRWKS